MHGDLALANGSEIGTSYSYRKVPIIRPRFINRSIFCSDRLKTIGLCSGLTDYWNEPIHVQLYQYQYR